MKNKISQQLRVKHSHNLLTVGSKWHHFPLSRISFPELKWVTWWRIQSRHHSSIIPVEYMNPWKTKKALIPLWYSACTGWSEEPRQSGLEGVVHELYEMKMLLETDKQYVSSCLPSTLSKFQSHRYSLSLKSWCIAQLVFMVDSSFSTWHTQWGGGGIFPSGTSVHTKQFPQSAVFSLSWYDLLLCHLNLETWSTSCLRSCVLLWTPALKHSAHKHKHRSGSLVRVSILHVKCLNAEMFMVSFYSLEYLHGVLYALFPLT